MKNKFLILSIFSLLGVFVNAQEEDVTLMTVNGRNIPKSYFEHIYFKNNAVLSDEQKSLNDYMELFKVFEMKVTEALSQGLDTLSSFKSELNSYRQQLAAPLLTDNRKREALVLEAYERMKENVSLSHILVMIEDKGGDTIVAYQKALDIIKRLKKEPFDKVAREVSDDKSAETNGGYLGYLSALWTVYPFETAAYSTPVGEISAPVRTHFGYHILKVHARRPNEKRLVAHIFKASNDSLPEQSAEAEKSIIALYEKVKTGEDFGLLAKENSDDRAAAQSNGEMWVESGKFVPEFEDTVFALTDSSRISKPFKTQYGWHIVKLVERKPIDSFDILKDNIERQIMRSDRAELISTSFVDLLKKQYDFQFDEKNYAYLQKLARETNWNDTLFFAQVEEVENKFGKNSLVLFSYCDKRKITTTVTTSNQRKETKTYINDKRNFTTFGDFVAYMQKRKLPSLTLSANIDACIKEELVTLKNKSLETENVDFRNLIQEYHDGILLFNISNKEVWEKAASDSEGLKKFFEKNRERYKWDEPRYKGQVFYCKDKKTLAQLKKILKSPADSVDVRLNRLNKGETVIKMNKGLFKKGTNNAVDAFIFKTGKYEPSDGFSEIYVRGKMQEKYPENYLDIKGLVTQDYQNLLEENWIAMLKQKYPVTINQAVLKTIKMPEK